MVLERKLGILRDLGAWAYARSVCYRSSTQNFALGSRAEGRGSVRAVPVGPKIWPKPGNFGIRQWWEGLATGVGGAGCQWWEGVCQWWVGSGGMDR